MAQSSPSAEETLAFDLWCKFERGPAQSSWRMCWIGRGARPRSFQLGRARGIHSIMAWPYPPPQGSAMVQGCILPAHLPAQGIRGFSQGKDRQSCAVLATSVIPGRTDMEPG
ncbi:hypothetical protein Nmel_017065 [Mimus melanotis]